MEIQSFSADSVAEAVATIRTQLGPDAVAVHVRPLPAPGMTRLWRKPRVEVLAYVPDAEPTVTSTENPMAELRQELEAIKLRLTAGERDTAPEPRGLFETSIGSIPAGEPPQTPSDVDGWHLHTLLHGIGLAPRFAQQLKDEIQQSQGASPPASIREEVKLVSDALRGHWRAANNRSAARIHVFVGAPGVGKSTLLCKCVARRLLTEGKPARVLQLDGRSANPNGLVNIYADILGVPVERFYSDSSRASADEVIFIDLPGLDWNDAEALAELREKLDVFEAPEVHLVLNGAYEVSTLLAQVRAFSCLPVSDLAITHLDEEKRWGKLWNLLLGTNYALRWLSAGQNIPGDLGNASAENLISHQTLVK